MCNNYYTHWSLFSKYEKKILFQIKKNFFPKSVFEKKKRNKCFFFLLIWKSDDNGVKIYCIYDNNNQIAYILYVSP